MAAAGSSWKYSDDFLIELQRRNHRMFKLFIQRFFKKEKSSAVLSDIQIKKPKTSKELYELFERHIQSSYVVDIKKILACQIGRQVNFINDLSQLPQINRPNKMLDFGCNDGVLTVCLNKHFEPMSLDGCDLVPVPEVFKQMHNWNYIKLTSVESQDIASDIKDEYQLITALNVLHHTKDPKKYLEFLVSKLSKGKSYLFLKEHDVTDGTINDCIIREWHRMYEVLYKEDYSMGEITYVPYAVLSRWIEELGGKIIYNDSKKINGYEWDFLEIYHLMAVFDM